MYTIWNDIGRRPVVFTGAEILMQQLKSVISFQSRSFINSLREIQTEEKMEIKKQEAWSMKQEKEERRTERKKEASKEGMNEGRKKGKKGGKKEV